MASFRIKENKFLIIDNKFAVGTGPCTCCDECCNETRDITISGLVGVFSLFNGTHTATRVGSTTPDNNNTCHYELAFYPTEAEVSAISPCQAATGIVVYLQFGVDDSGLAYASLSSTSFNDVATYTRAGYSGSPGVDIHEWWDCTISDRVVDDWLHTLVAGDHLVPCP